MATMVNGPIGPLVQHTIPALDQCQILALCGGGKMYLLSVVIMVLQGVTGTKNKNGRQEAMVDF